MENTFFQNKTIVHVRECFSEDLGAYDKVYWLDGLSLEMTGLTARDSIPTPRINALPEQIELAQELYTSQAIYRQGRHIIGSTVILQRSRKAPNKVPVLIVDYAERHFDGSYWQDEKIQVADATGELAWTASSCIKEILKNPLDW